MSYCRWSSDDFKSDLYVYAHVDGSWTIHVASNRIVGSCPPQAWPTDAKDQAQLEAFRASEIARHEFLDRAAHVVIGLPHDGKTFKLASPGECADQCGALAALGYVVPAHVVPALREEQADMDAEEVGDGGEAVHVGSEGEAEAPGRTPNKEDR